MTSEEYIEELDKLYKIALEQKDVSMALELLERKKNVE